MDVNKYENFSKAGKDSIEKYFHHLSKKNVSKYDNNSLNDRNIYDLDENVSLMLHEDIFSKTYENNFSGKANKKKSRLFSIKSACSYLNKNKNRKTYGELFDIFKKKLSKKYDKYYRYHLLHHNDINENMLNSKNNGPSISNYKPKFEYTYKKLIYSLPFQKMSGRQNLLLPKAIEEKNNDKRNSSSILEQLSLYNKFSSSFNMNNKIMKKIVPISSDVEGKNKQNKNMDKNKKIQLISQPKKIIKKESPDYKVSKNLNFTNSELNFKKIKIGIDKKQRNIKILKKVKSEKNGIIKLKRKKNENADLKRVLSVKNISNKSNKISSPYKTNTKNSTNSKLILFCNEEKNHDLENNKNNILEKTKKYKGLNFKKMLSREYLNKINKIKRPVDIMFTPNYSLVRPKTIMKVIYSKSKKNENKKDIIAYTNDFSYDINNIFDKYNNHNSPKYFNLGKMSSRYDKGKSELPLFMLKTFYRNSLDYLSEKSLKMNNYSKGSFQDIFSSFNEKKSFNQRLKLEVLNKENKIMEYNNKHNIQKNQIQKIRYSNEKGPKSQVNFFPKNTWLKNKLGEFYQKDYDDLDNDNFIGSKVDGITFKLYKSNSRYKNDLLNKYEKELFSPF